MSYSDTFAGLAGISISTIGTLALAKEVTKSMRDITREPRRRQAPRRRVTKSKRR